MEELISEKIEDERKNIRLQCQWLEKKIEEIETVRQTMKSELPVKLVLSFSISHRKSVLKVSSV